MSTNTSHRRLDRMRCIFSIIKVDSSKSGHCEYECVWHFLPHLHSRFGCNWIALQFFGSQVGNACATAVLILVHQIACAANEQLNLKLVCACLDLESKFWIRPFGPPSAFLSFSLLLFSLGNSSPDDVNSFQFVVLVAALHQLTALSISLLTNPLHFTASLLLPSAFLLYFILLIKQLKTPLWYDQSWAPHWNWAPFQEERRQNQWHLSARMPASQLARRKC